MSSAEFSSAATVEHASTDKASQFLGTTSPVTYPCLLSALFLPAKRISRNCAESPEGTGIRSTGWLN